jgi:hypothetical protein
MAPKRRSAFDPYAELSTEKKKAKTSKTKVVLGDPKEMSAIVAKKTRDNFKGWASVAIDGTLRSGLSLRGTLARDYQRHLAEPIAFPMGASYYAGIKELVRAGDPAAKKFVVKNPRDTVAGGLLVAMKETQHYHKNVQPLLTQMQLMTSCNQKELIGILKFNDTLRPSVSTMQWNTSIAIARFVVRLNPHKVYEEEIALARGTFDKALVAAFESLHRDGVSIKNLLDMHMDIMLLVCSVDDFACLVDRARPWASVREPLTRVVSCSEIGKRMFSFAMAHIIALEVSNFTDKEILGLMDGDLLPKVVVAFKQKTVVATLAMPGFDVLPQRRLVQVRIRGALVKVGVESVYDEVDIKSLPG